VGAVYDLDAFAANRAHTCATYALVTDGSHRITFDEVVRVMWQPGKDLPLLYRETGAGGLAEVYRSGQTTAKMAQLSHSPLSLRAMWLGDGSQRLCVIIILCLMPRRRQPWILS
jgi:hypothetical protein